MLATNSLDTPVLGLVARRDGEKVRLPELRAAIATHAIHAEAVDLFDDFALAGSFIAGPESLATFSAGAPMNTDDHPVVAYLAPRVTYHPDSTPRSRLLALLGELRIQPEELFAEATDAEWNRRLAAYWQARNRYLELGSTIRPTGDVSAMLEQVRAPLLGVLRISPDFRPAYDPLVNMARALGRTDPQDARSLLAMLATVNPHGIPRRMRWRRSPPPDYWSRYAMQSTSTCAPIASPVTPSALRAGKRSVK